MSDKQSLLLSGLLVAFFFVAGLLDLLDSPIVMAILFVGFLAIGINIVVVKSKDNS